MGTGASFRDDTWLSRTTGGSARTLTFREHLGAASPNDEEIAPLNAAKTLRFGAYAESEEHLLRTGVAEMIEAARAEGAEGGSCHDD